MNGTRAVPTEVLEAANPGGLANTPLCPACLAGYLHPFHVNVGTRANGAGFCGADFLFGWVAICQGNAEYARRRQKLLIASGDVVEPLEIVPGCGFSMPLTAGRLGGGTV